MFNIFKLLGYSFSLGFADNVAITAGSGTTIAADEVADGTLGTVKVQYVKIMDGTLDGTSKAAVGSGGLKVDLSGTGANSTAVKVDGSAVTQPVSASSLPLPTGASTSANQTTANTSLSSIDGKITACNTGAVVVSSSALPSGAATAAKQPALGTAGTASADVITVQGIASMTALKVDGSAVTQPVSAASLPLPSGASTAAKQPALGTAGTPSADVITVQGITSMTALKVDGSAVTQPVSGTVSITSNSAVNISQMNGVTVAMDAGATSTGTQRVVQANGAGKTILSATGSASSSGNNTIVAAGTNKLKVFAFSLTTTSTTAVTCKFQSGASGTDLWSVVLQAGTSTTTGANLSVSPPAWLFATGSATLLNLNLSSANAVQWSVSYFDEA